MKSALSPRPRRVISPLFSIPSGTRSLAKSSHDVDGALSPRWALSCNPLFFESLSLQCFPSIFYFARIRTIDLSMAAADWSSLSEDDDLSSLALLFFGLKVLLLGLDSLSFDGWPSPTLRMRNPFSARWRCFFSSLSLTPIRPS